MCLPHSCKLYDMYFEERSKSNYSGFSLITAPQLICCFENISFLPWQSFNKQCHVAERIFWAENSSMMIQYRATDAEMIKISADKHLRGAYLLRLRSSLHLWLNIVPSLNCCGKQQWTKVSTIHCTISAIPFENLFFYNGHEFVLQPKLSMAKCRRNVENFLEACRKMGVPEVISKFKCKSALFLEWWLAHAQ